MRVKVDVVVRAHFADDDISEVVVLESYRDYQNPGELISHFPELLETAGRLYSEQLADLEEDDDEQ